MATTATRSHSLVATALHSHTYGQLQHHQLMPHTTIFTGNLHRCCPSHLVEFLSILSLISIYVHSPYVHGAQRRTSSLGPAADTHVSRKSHISEKVSPPPRSTLTGHRPHHALFTPLSPSLFKFDGWHRAVNFLHSPRFCSVDHAHTPRAFLRGPAFDVSSFCDARIALHAPSFECCSPRSQRRRPAVLRDSLPTPTVSPAADCSPRGATPRTPRPAPGPGRFKGRTECARRSRAWRTARDRRRASRRGDRLMRSPPAPPWSASRACRSGCTRGAPACSPPHSQRCHPGPSPWTGWRRCS
jgi:hypothetical protein